MDLSDFRKNLNPTQAQTKEGDIVAFKRRGRPRKPGQQRVSIVMPAVFHAELRQFCAKTGVSKSEFIMQCIKSMMADETARNKLLVDKFL